MKGLDWESIFLDFVASRRMSTHSLYVVKSFIRFLDAGSYACLTEDVVLKWLKEQLPLKVLEIIMTNLRFLKPFLLFLEEKGISSPGLFRQLWECPDLLARLGGVPIYSEQTGQLEEYWRQVLSAFEASLRGISSYHAAGILRIAGDFVAVLQRRGTRCPDEEIFLEWLDRGIASYKVSTLIRRNLPCLARFCQFLQERYCCPSNPIQDWRRLHVTVGDALKRRKQHKPPPLRPPRFQSFLSARLEAFIAHKRTLGRKYVNDAYVLGLFDRHVKERRIENFSELDESFFSSFMKTYSCWKASTRARAFCQIGQFLHFLVRQGDIPQEQNPARFLPRIAQPPCSTHIFSLKEIANVLCRIREAPYRSTFDRQMLFTLFHQIYACGLRISEAIRLEVRDVNFKERTLFIRKTKFGKSRLIPLGNRAVEYLEHYHRLRVERLGMPEESVPLFVRAIGHPYCKVNLESIFRQACKEAGVVLQIGSRYRVHDLRHAMAVHRLYKWYLDGENPQERLQLLSLYMGHSKVTHTEHYLHLAQDLLRIAGRPLQRLIERWLRERQEYEDEN